MRRRVRVEPIRDPDTREVLGWIARCPSCRGYLVGGRTQALNAGHRHDCGPPAALRRWRWPW